MYVNFAGISRVIVARFYVVKYVKLRSEMRGDKKKIVMYSRVISVRIFSSFENQSNVRTSPAILIRI